MNQSDRQVSAGRVVIVAAALVVVIAGLKAADSIVVPFLVAGFLAVLCTPPMRWLESKGVPTAAALFVVASLAAVAGLLFTILLGHSVNDFVGKLPEYKLRLEGHTGELVGWLRERGLRIETEAVQQRGLNASRLLDLTGMILAGVRDLFGNVVLVILMLVFMLLEAAGFPDKLRAVGSRSEERVDRFYRIVSTIRQYVGLKTWLSLLTGILVGVWIWLLGVDYPLLWGMLAFLLNYVPNIGSIIAAVPAVVLALLQNGLASSGYTALGYVVINAVVGNLIEPRIMGRGLGLSTLVVFLSLIFWGWVLGPVGMLLSVPLTMMIKIILESGETTRWIAVLLGPEIPAADAGLEQP